MPCPFRDGLKIAVIIDLFPYSLAEKVDTHGFTPVALIGEAWL